MRQGTVTTLADVLSRRVTDATHESLELAKCLPDPNDWLHDVDANVSRVVRRSENFETSKRALFGAVESIFQEARTHGIGLQLDANQAAAMEALVALDGSRPSLAVTNRTVDFGDPFIGKWRTRLQAIEATIIECVSCVGRIEQHEVGATKLFGTGCLYDRDRGLVLTASHVLRSLNSSTTHHLHNDVSSFTNGPVIDFCGEQSSSERARFKVISGSSVLGSRAVDAAVLRIRPLSETEAELCGDTVVELPRAATLNTMAFDDARPITGSLCLVGFPEKPVPGGYLPSARAAIDWHSVVEALTGGVYGIKRLSPGLPLTQPSLSSPKFGHDATTLFGSSGSPTFAWNDANAPAIGVHVSGTLLLSNFAEWIPGFASDLKKAETRLLNSS